MSALRIAMGADVILAGQLNDAPSAQDLGTALPVGGVAALWGRAICFAAPLAVHPDDPQAPTVAVGAFAYWLPGQAICLCWGAAPDSVDERPRVTARYRCRGASRLILPRWTRWRPAAPFGGKPRGPHSGGRRLPPCETCVHDPGGRLAKAVLCAKRAPCLQLPPRCRSPRSFPVQYGRP